jgi:uncharacterized protein
LSGAASQVAAKPSNPPRRREAPEAHETNGARDRVRTPPKVQNLARAITPVTPTDSRSRDVSIIPTAGAALPSRDRGGAPEPLPSPAPAVRHRGPESDGQLQAQVIYSRADSEVEPPWLLRPQLPKEPAPGADAGVFEIVVDETGDVEEVRLKSPERRYQERMLVAAAKAWKFRPARLNGEAVKYRLRVPVDLPDPR